MRKNTWEKYSRTNGNPKIAGATFRKSSRRDVYVLLRDDASKPADPSRIPCAPRTHGDDGALCGSAEMFFSLYCSSDRKKLYVTQGGNQVGLHCQGAEARAIPTTLKI